MTAKKPKVVINKGKKRNPYVRTELLAKTSDGNDKFFVTCLRGDGDADSEALKDKIDALNDEDAIKAVVTKQVQKIELRDDDGKWIPYCEEVFDWVWVRPAYQRLIVRAMYAAAADIKFNQDRLGN